MVLTITISDGLNFQNAVIICNCIERHVDFLKKLWGVCWDLWDLKTAIEHGPINADTKREHEALSGLIHQETLQGTSEVLASDKGRFDITSEIWEHTNVDTSI